VDLAERFAQGGNHRGMAGPGYGSDRGRYDCMVEINPWTSEAEALTAMLYRGVIVSAWGFIETHLNETAIRCSWHPAYTPIAAKYPRILHDRLQYLRNVLAAPGPLEAYQGFAQSFLDRFAAGAALRNTMAHARMDHQPMMGIRFTEVGRFDGDLQHRYTRYRLEDLAAMARRATRLSRLCQRTIAWINQNGLLPRDPEAAAALIAANAATTTPEISEPPSAA